MSLARSSWLASISSNQRRSTAARSLAVVLRQARNARDAASIACCVSARPSFGTVPTTSPVAGLAKQPRVLQLNTDCCFWHSSHPQILTSLHSYILTFLHSLDPQIENVSDCVDRDVRRRIRVDLRWVVC